MSTDTVISLSLISHTNAGKTTLARTLLGRDIGIVRDEAHVTEIAEKHTLIETAAGDRLVLWDTPGFGDSARLARRLESANEPVGWFLGQVWDRLRDRALWASQQAVRNVREHADVVLYLVNATEPAGQAPYVEDEMRILDWIGKPVVVLLNQLGPPADDGENSAGLAEWRDRLAPARPVRAVLALDAFARCWVQEATLLRTIADILPPADGAAWQRLFDCWLQRRRTVFDQSVGILAQALAQIAIDRELVPETGLTDWVAGLVKRLVRDARKDGRGLPVERRRAMDALARRLDEELRSATNRLIRLHGLDGRAQAEIFQRLAAHYQIDAGIPEGKASVFGGIVAGALGGLKADLATGGLSMGAGALVGTALGAMGAFGLARGYNLLRDTTESAIGWSDGALEAAAVAAMLSYLAIAHYGRGRGDWIEDESPAHWHALAQATVRKRQADFSRAWSLRDAIGPRPAAPAGPPPAEDARDPGPAGAAALVSALRNALAGSVLDMLQQLYPVGARDSKLTQDERKEAEQGMRGENRAAKAERAGPARH